MDYQQRRDIAYSIMSRFEEYIRQYISTFLPLYYPHITDGIPQGIVQKALERSEHEGEVSISIILENTDFIDLSEIILFKNTEFYSVRNEVTDFKQIMHDIYVLRCKIAHVRGYFTSLDLEDLLTSTQEISLHLGVFGEQFLRFLEDLNQSPIHHITTVPESFSCDIVGVPNNLPTPDYEFEGGFVGRKEDIQKIIKLVDGGHRVVTITGAGGVGKTALALKVVYELAYKSVKKYDGIVWVSAKENKLSYLGIEDIEPTIKNYDDLLDTICQVMGFDVHNTDTNKKEEDVATIFSIYSSILLVIDNLETITDDRIIEFVLDFNPKLNILITSRRGLGQVERRYELKQLKEKEAIALFRLIAKDKNLDDLAKVDESILSGYVKKLSCYPLAIKWVIGHVASGRDIYQIIDSIHEDTSDISKFCFDQIYKELPLEGKKLLCAMSVIEEPPAAGVLKYVVNLDQDVFQDNISQLILFSLVIPDSVKASDSQLITKYSLLPLTRGYVRQQLDRDTSLKAEIDDRFKAVFHTIEEADRAAKEYRYTLYSLAAQTDEEKVAAMLANTAHQKYGAGRYEDAVEDYKRALGIAPRFPALYRNWAVMESNEGHSLEADKLMEKATKLAPDDAMMWLTWGNIKRKGDRIKDAQGYYDKALKLKPDDSYILNALGQVKYRLGEYADAETLLRKALASDSRENSTRHTIINKSSLAENFRRWAEALKRDTNFVETNNKLQEALIIIDEVLELNAKDAKSCEIKAEILFDLGKLHAELDPRVAIKYLLTGAKSLNATRYKHIKGSFGAALLAAKLFVYKLNDNENAKKVYDHYLDKLVYKLKNDDYTLRDSYNELLNVINIEKTRCLGRIIEIFRNRKYFVIERDDMSEIRYLGQPSEVIANEGHRSIDDLLDVKVSFLPIEKPSMRDKYWATSIKILESKQ